MIWLNGVLVSPGEGGVYGERMIGQFRVWNPYRSKLAALYYLGSGPELNRSMKVLYLGAAHGTTVSHIADYVEAVYAVEFSPRPVQDLLEVAMRRMNIIPIMADANRPEMYAPFMERIDLVYQDIAQPGQVGIAIRNSVFLKKGGSLVLMLKTRSVDSRKNPEQVKDSSVAECNAGGIRVTSSVWLSPYHRDHAALICVKDE